MIPAFSIVRLKEPDIVHGVKREDTGTIVDVIENGDAYTVEFIDKDGASNLAALMNFYKEEQLEIVRIYN